MPDVEVLSTGGPVHGVGSPPEGDFWTREQLEAIAAANRALAAEIKAPNKIGHSDAQTLVKNSALAVPTPGEMPAVGWLDGATARVVDDPDTGGAKLVMDARAVPKKFAQLVKVGAYRTRSAELSRVTSQVTQKAYDWVVTGLAWLGAKLPAVQTLDDVVALYERAELPRPPDVRAFVVYAAEGQLVWEPGESFGSLRDAVARALNGPPTGGMNEPRFWVSDVNVAGDKALAMDYYDESRTAYVIPFARDANGEVTLSPSSDWTRAEEGWIAVAKEYARVFAAAAESTPMPRFEFTDEQLAALREKLGVEGDLTEDAITAAVDARANELAEATRKAEEAETRKNEADEQRREFEQVKAKAEAAEQRLFEMARDTDIEKATREGRLDPADVEKWEKRYETLGPDQARELLFELPVVEERVRELGREGDPGEADEVTKSYEAEIARNTGVPVEELI